VTLKTLKFSHPVNLRVRVISHNNPVYSSTALRDHSFSWKHIVVSLEARSSSLCAKHEEISAFFFLRNSCSIPGHPCWICVGYSGIETGCSSSTVVYPFIIILIIFHTHLHLDTIPLRRRCGRSVGIQVKQCSVGYRRCWTEKYFHLLSSRQSF
jgi:hypothetical protein